jgi:hypothetical protein
MHQIWKHSWKKSCGTQEEWKHILGRRSRYENIGVQGNLPNIVKICNIAHYKRSQPLNFWPLFLLQTNPNLGQLSMRIRTHIYKQELLKKLLPNPRSKNPIKTHI